MNNNSFLFPSHLNALYDKFELFAELHFALIRAHGLVKVLRNRVKQLHFFLKKV